MAGLKRRKRTKIDHDVIRTEPDHRRASGAGDDDDDVEDEAVSRTPKYEPVYTTRDDVIHRRRWTARKSKTQELRFPFFSLPAEIRNMVYRCLVVSQRDEPIDLTADGNKRFPSGKIETAILFANKQVCHDLLKFSPSTMFCGQVTIDIHFVVNLPHRHSRKLLQYSTVTTGSLLESARSPKGSTCGLIRKRLYQQLACR